MLNCFLLILHQAMWKSMNPEYKIFSADREKDHSLPLLGIGAIHQVEDVVGSL